ncbi:hypothetical protein C1645_879129 [Glomus cerebriforme]|uniref:Uncharacterized protein n=1 Tax=Glomus cerebriforme TaxID=658196 RepID=A0A397SM94_9GLOM|nr:hypothetical protein C1645_879129 [Glomus cerebriforme]
MARLSWIMLLVFVVLLVNFVSNSPVESATKKRRNINARENVLLMVARNIPTEFSGTNKSILLRKRTSIKGKRYNNPTPNYHKRNKN